MLTRRTFLAALSALPLISRISQANPCLEVPPPRSRTWRVGTNQRWVAVADVCHRPMWDDSDYIKDNVRRKAAELWGTDCLPIKVVETSRCRYQALGKEDNLDLAAKRYMGMKFMWVEVTGSIPRIADLPLSEIVGGNRQSLNRPALHLLVEDIVKRGVVLPIFVRPYRGKYQVLDGLHRLEAARRAGLEKIPCIIHSVSDRELNSGSIGEKDAAFKAAYQNSVSRRT